MTTRPPKSRTRNPEQTRNKLLQATVKLISDKGVEALSLKEAAQAANISRATAYQHFDNREHLVKEAKEWLSRQLLDTLASVDASSSLEENVFQMTKLLMENRDAAKLFAIDLLSDNQFYRENPLYKLLLTSLDQFKARDDTREDIDNKLLSFIMLGSIFSALLAQMNDEGESEAIARQFTGEWTRLLRHGLFKDGQGDY